MYILTVEDHFSSAHQLRNYGGPCENIHGHNWRVVLAVKGTVLDDTGLLVDFHELKAILKGVLSRLDHRLLNEIPPFDTMNPSSENIARYIAEEIGKKFGKNVSLDSVTVWESDTSRCTYVPGD